MYILKFDGNALHVGFESNPEGLTKKQLQIRDRFTDDLRSGSSLVGGGSYMKWKHNPKFQERMDKLLERNGWSDQTETTTTCFCCTGDTFYHYEFKTSDINLLIKELHFINDMSWKKNGPFSKFFRGFINGDMADLLELVQSNEELTKLTKILCAASEQIRDKELSKKAIELSSKLQLPNKIADRCVRMVKRNPGLEITSAKAQAIHTQISSELNNKPLILPKKEVHGVAKLPDAIEIAEVVKQVTDAIYEELSLGIDDDGNLENGVVNIAVGVWIRKRDESAKLKELPLSRAAMFGKTPELHNNTTAAERVAKAAAKSAAKESISQLASLF